MNENLSGLLNTLMSNPEALKGIMGSLSKETPTPPADKPNDFGDVGGKLNSLSNFEDKRISLLTALKPYLSGSRGANVDKAIQLIKLAKMTEAMRNEGK